MDIISWISPYQIEVLISGATSSSEISVATFVLTSSSQEMCPKARRFLHFGVHSTMMILVNE